MPPDIGAFLSCRMPPGHLANVWSGVKCLAWRPSAGVLPVGVAADRLPLNNFCNTFERRNATLLEKNDRINFLFMDISMTLLLYDSFRVLSNIFMAIQMKSASGMHKRISMYIGVRCCRSTHLDASWIVYNEVAPFIWKGCIVHGTYVFGGEHSGEIYVHGMTRNLDGKEGDFDVFFVERSRVSIKM